MKSTRVCRGNYIQGHFLKISDPNGEILSTDPGNLDYSPVIFPFSFEHVHEAVTAAKTQFCLLETPSCHRRDITTYAAIKI